MALINFELIKIAGVSKSVGKFIKSNLSKIWQLNRPFAYFDLTFQITDDRIGVSLLPKIAIAPLPVIFMMASTAPF